MLSAMGGGGDGAPIQGLAAGLPPPTQKELAQALDVATRFEVHIAQVIFGDFHIRCRCLRCIWLSTS